MSQETKVNNKYIVNVQGKDFVTFPGLLAIAHEKGLIGINTDLVNNDLTNPVIKATVSMRDASNPEIVRVFTGYGDASVNNVAKKVAGALIRMAETRSVARALRFATNIDMTAIEELDVDESIQTNKASSSSSSTAKTNGFLGNKPVTGSQTTLEQPKKSVFALGGTVTKPISNGNGSSKLGGMSARLAQQQKPEAKEEDPEF